MVTYRGACNRVRHTALVWQTTVEWEYHRTTDKPMWRIKKNFVQKITMPDILKTMQTYQDKRRNQMAVMHSQNKNGVCYLVRQ